MKFALMSGTAIGHTHIEEKTNGQDGYAVRQTAGSLVLVVTDGCGSAPHSEVGAKLFAPIVASKVSTLIRRGADLTQAPIREHLKQLLLGKMLGLADDMTGEEKLSQILLDYFQFTILIMVVTPEQTIFLRLGDGVIGYNGNVDVLKPERRNSPAYLVYNLHGNDMTAANPHLLDFQVAAVLPTRELEEFWIGTDGGEDYQKKAVGRNLDGETVLSIPHLLRHPDYQKYPHHLGRVLQRLADDGVLKDDTTILGGYVLEGPEPQGTGTNSDTADAATQQTDAEETDPGADASESAKTDRKLAAANAQSGE